MLQWTHSLGYVLYSVEQELELSPLLSLSTILLFSDAIVFTPMLSSMPSYMQQSTAFYRRGRECFQQHRPNPHRHGLDCLACHGVQRFSSIVLIVAGMGLIASHVTELCRRLACTSMDGYRFRHGVAFLGWIRLQFYSNRR